MTIGFNKFQIGEPLINSKKPVEDKTLEPMEQVEINRIERYKRVKEIASTCNNNCAVACVSSCISNCSGSCSIYCSSHASAMIGSPSTD